MLVQIFASSAWTGVVLTIGAPNSSNVVSGALGGGLADAADDAWQRRDLLEEPAGGDPLRGVRDEHVLADLQAAALLDVAGDELGRSRRDRRAQDQAMAGAQQRHQVVDRGADLAQVALEVIEGRRPDRDHDVVGRGGVGRALGELQPAGRGDAVEQLLGAGLVPRHPACADRVEHRSGRGRRRARGRPRSANDSASGRPTRPKPITEIERSSVIRLLKRTSVRVGPMSAALQGGRLRTQRVSPTDTLGIGFSPGSAACPRTSPAIREPVQPRDLALSLDPGGMAGGEVADQLADPLAQLQREMRRRGAHQLPYVVDCHLATGTQTIWILGLAHFWGTASRRLSTWA